MSAGDGVAGSEHHPEIDWKRAAGSPEFQDLVKRKRRFVLPATAFFMAWYFGFIILAGYAPDFMGESIYEGFTVGYLFALTQFVMVWVLAAWYLRRADKVFDPLAEKAAARAVEVGGNGAPSSPRRIDPAETERAGDERPPATSGEEARP